MKHRPDAPDWLPGGMAVFSIDGVDHMLVASAKHLHVLSLPDAEPRQIIAVPDATNAGTLCAPGPRPRLRLRGRSHPHSGADLTGLGLDAGAMFRCPGRLKFRRAASRFLLDRPSSSNTLITTHDAAAANMLTLITTTLPFLPPILGPISSHPPPRI